MWHAIVEREKARENTRSKYIYSQKCPMSTTKSSFDDDCFRLKICSLNWKDLRSNPDGISDQMIKSEFRIFITNVVVGEFRVQKSQQIPKNHNFLNSLLPRKFNFGFIRLIRKFIMIGQFSNLGEVKILGHNACGTWTQTRQSTVITRESTWKHKKWKKNQARNGQKQAR